MPPCVCGVWSGAQRARACTVVDTIRSLRIRPNYLLADRIDDLAACLYHAAVNLVAMQRQISVNDFRTDMDF